MELSSCSSLISSAVVSSACNALLPGSLGISRGQRKVSTLAKIYWTTGQCKLHKCYVLHTINDKNAGDLPAMERRRGRGKPHHHSADQKASLSGSMEAVEDAIVCLQRHLHVPSRGTDSGCLLLAIRTPTRLLSSQMKTSAIIPAGALPPIIC